MDIITICLLGGKGVLHAQNRTKCVLKSLSRSLPDSKNKNKIRVFHISHKKFTKGVTICLIIPHVITHFPYYFYKSIIHSVKLGNLIILLRLASLVACKQAEGRFVELTK